MANNWSPVAVIGHVLTGIGLTLLIVCQATSEWQMANSNLVKVGLYKSCFASVCSDIGWNISVDSGFFAFYITRCILIACDILVGVALVCLMVTSCVENKCSTLRAGGGLYLTAGIIITIGCIFFTSYNTVFTFASTTINVSNFTNYGYSFYLGWVCGPLCAVGGSMIIIGSQPQPSQQVVPQPQVIWTSTVVHQSNDPGYIQQPQQYYN